MPTIATINALSPDEFVAALGGIFEHSAWVAEAAEKERPFLDIGGLHETMTGIAARSPLEKQLALIRAHPDLAGRLARQGQLTAESTREQASAGLATAGTDTLAKIDELNTAYRARFDFPFIICARLNNVETILQAMETRIHHTTDEEIATALSEIGKIAGLRLADLIEN